MIIACWRKFLLLHDAVYNVSMMHCKSECDPEARGHRPVFEKIDFTDFLLFLIKGQGMGRLSLNYTMPLPNAIAPGGSLLQAVFTACLYEKTILAFFAPFFYNVHKSATCSLQLALNIP